MNNSAIEYISGFTDWLFLIIPVGAGAMVSYLATRKALTDDDGVIADCNKKIKNAIYGSAIGLSLPSFIKIITVFFRVGE